MKIPVVVAGATGKTGGAVGRALYHMSDMDLVGVVARKQVGAELGPIWGEPALHLLLAGSLDAIDVPYAVLVDFTEPESAYARLVSAVERHWDIVVGTTGFSKQHRDDLAGRVQARGRGAAIIANFSLGAYVAEKLAREASRYFAQVEIIEGHHAQKTDRPSGTAKAMAEVLAAGQNRPLDSIPVHSLRLPGMVAHQAVVFGSEGQIVTIRHDVHDRTAYVEGVIQAVRRVHELSGRVITDLGEVLNS